MQSNIDDVSLLSRTSRKEAALRELHEEYQRLREKMGPKPGKHNRRLIKQWRIMRKAKWELEWPELPEEKERREEEEKVRLANVRSREADRRTIEVRLEVRIKVMRAAGKSEEDIQAVERSIWRKWKEDFPQEEVETAGGYNLGFLDDDGDSVWTEDTDEEGGCLLTDWESSDNESDGAYDSDGTVTGDCAGFPSTKGSSSATQS